MFIVSQFLLKEKWWKFLSLKIYWLISRQTKFAKYILFDIHYCEYLYLLKLYYSELNTYILFHNLFF